MPMTLHRTWHGLAAKTDWKYSEQADSTTLWACRCRPPAASVTSTRDSACSTQYIVQYTVHSTRGGCRLSGGINVTSWCWRRLGKSYGILEVA